MCNKMGLKVWIESWTGLDSECSVILEWIEILLVRVGNKVRARCDSVTLLSDQ